MGGGGEGGLRGPSHLVWLRNLESFLEEVRFQQGFRRMGISCPSEMQGVILCLCVYFFLQKFPFSLFYLKTHQPNSFKCFCYPKFSDFFTPPPNFIVDSL